MNYEKPEDSDSQEEAVQQQSHHANQKEDKKEELHIDSIKLELDQPEPVVEDIFKVEPKKEVHQVRSAHPPPAVEK